MNDEEINMSKLRPSLGLSGEIKVLCFLPDMPLQGEDQMNRMRLLEKGRKISETKRRLYAEGKIVPWNKITIPRDNLYNLYINQKLSSIEIGKIYGVCSSTILKLLHEYGIKVRTEGDRPPEKILELYESGLSIREVAKIFKRSEPWVRRWIHLLGGSLRTVSEAKKVQWARASFKEKMDPIMKKVNESKAKVPSPIIKKLYEEKKSLNEIAELVELDPSQIRKRLIRMGVRVRSRGEGLKILWGKPEYVKKMRTPRVPNKPELRFIEICDKYNLPFKYNGDGQLWIGKVNPDFIENNGRKIAVDIFGCYWHSPLFRRNISYCQTLEGREKILASHSWKLIVFWDSELNSPDGEKIVLDRLQEVLKKWLS